jgi:hypothetical protein
MTGTHGSPSFDGSQWFSALCPLTLTVLHDAVKAEDGRIYERSAIREWNRVHGDNLVSPVTGKPMGAVLTRDKTASAHAAKVRAALPPSANGRGLQSVQSTIFEELDKIQRLCLVDKLNLRAPSLMAIGNENSGKSTLFECLIGFPVLPRAEGLCTRMMIRLLLRRGPYTPAKVSVRTRGARPEEISSEYAAAAKLREVVQRVMAEQVALSPTALMMDRELTVLIQLPHLCNLNIIDLPGLVATGSPHSADMPQLTQQLAESAIDEEGDFATYLLVTEATTPANQSLASALIMRRKLQARTLGVMTKLDCVATRNDDDTVPRRVADVVLGRAAGSVPLEPAGWVAVANRDPPMAILQQVGDDARDAWRLFKVDEAEQDLLSGWLNALEAEAAALLGMAVMRRRVEEYFEHHLVERWIPKLLARLAEEARRLTVENQRRGLPMPPHPQYAALAAQLSALLPATAQGDRAGAVLELVKGWTPATAEVIRWLLQMRAVSRMGLEPQDWMGLSARTEVWSEIQAMAKRPAEANTEWARLPSMPYAVGSELAERELVTLHNRAKVLVELLRSMASDALATLLCDAIFAQPARPSTVFPDSNDYFTPAAQGQRPAAGLQQGSDEEQAALTRMSRFAALRAALHEQLQRDMEVAAASFAEMALELVWRCAPAVDLRYEPGSGASVARCVPRYRESAGLLGHDVLRLWLETVVLPMAERTQQLAVGRRDGGGELRGGAR